MKRLILIILLLGSWSNIAWAAKVTNLYQVAIPIASQSNDLRGPAFQQALQAALVKASGNSHIAEQAAIESAIKNPSAYIEEYTYQPNPAAGAGALPYLLNVSFQAAAIKNLLGSQIWLAERPTLLAWVLVQDGQGKRLIGGSSTTEAVYNLMQTQSNQRGMPLTFPALDLTDLQKVSLDTVEQNSSTIQTASRRYQHDAIVITQYVQDSDGSWTGQAELLIDGEPQQWKITGKDNIAVVTESMDTVIDALAKRYLSANPTSQSEVTFTVTQADSMDKYAQIIDYLQHLNIVKQVSLQQVGPTQLQFKLTIAGDVNTLQKAANSSEHLARAPTHSTSQLTYAWQP